MYSICLAAALAAAPALAADHDSATGTTPASPAAASATPTAASSPASTAAPPEADGQPTPTSPLSIHIGDADLTVGGFMDATVVSRSTNVGSGIGTSFGGVPFGNTVPGNLPETRFSAQNSRVSLMATSKLGSASVKGYLEADFLGAGPANLNVTSNANTLRMRLYWVQFTAGKFEFLGGQSWSLMTPGRSGLSPMPADVFYSQDMDTNYQLGLPWGRTPGFRLIAHASDTVTAGVALENPQQYVGSAVVLPAAFPASQVDATGNTAAPNPFPDVIGKIAFDPKTGKTHQHIEAAVLMRGFKTYDPATTATTTETGTGFSVNAVIEPVHNFRIVGTSFISNGGGRYIANLNLPDFIVNGDQSLTLVKSRSFMVGPEITIKNSLIYGYYSWVQADQALTTDVNGRVIGFGVPGAAGANHTANEPTIGLTQTFFKDPKIGGMQMILQFSEVNRTPFSVPVGTPGEAKSKMFFFDIRYLLP